jgi:hypothetical protein
MTVFKCNKESVVKLANFMDWLYGKNPRQLELIPCDFMHGHPTGGPLMFTPSMQINDTIIGTLSDRRAAAIVVVMGVLGVTNRFHFYVGEHVNTESRQEKDDISKHPLPPGEADRIGHAIVRAIR